MKLQQLRYITAMTRHHLNVSETADALFTSQPGVSKQIRLLEEELGLEIFTRQGKHITAVTPEGERVIALAQDILGKVAQIQAISHEHRNPHTGDLRIGTTHTQARYVLPPVVKAFGDSYPRVSLHIHQGTPNQLADMLNTGEVDLVIATEEIETFTQCVTLPCYRWDRSVIVPRDHPLHKLARLDGISLEALAKYPIVTYVFAFTGHAPLDKVFQQKGLQANVVLTAVDTDVIKTYVRLGVGVGIIAEMAHDPHVDKDLVTLDADTFLPSSTTYICLKPKRPLRAYTYAFIARFSATLQREFVDQVLAANEAERQALLQTITPPRY